MKRTLWSIVVAGFAGVSAGSLAAAPAGQTPAQPDGKGSRPAGPLPALTLRDSRLEEPVEYSLRTGSLDDCVRGLADRAQVELDVDDPLQSARVSVLNGSAATHRLLHDLEWVAAATWIAPGGKLPYRLEQTARDRGLAAAARAREERLGLARLRERWEQVAQWAFLSAQQLQDLQKSEPAMASCLADSRSSAMSRLGYSLPAGFWNQVWDSGSARMPISGLSSDLQALAFVGGGADNKVQHSGLTEDLMRSGGMLKLQIAGPPDHETVWLSLSTPFGSGLSGLRSTDNNLLYPEGWARQSPARRRADTLAHPSPVPEAPLFRQKVSLLDKHSPASAEVANRPEGCLPLLPLAEQLAAQVHVPVLVQTDFRPRPDAGPNAGPDAGPHPKQDRAWQQRQWWLAEPIREQPLARALDLLCADFEYQWIFRDGAILLRHKRWYLPEEDRAWGKRLDPIFRHPPGSKTQEEAKPAQ